MTAPIDRVLSQLPDARQTVRGWTARCVAHDDRGPSLSIGTGSDGRVLLRCFAGCSAEAIARALGLTLRDLFADTLKHNDEGRDFRRVYEAAPVATIEAYLVREIERQRAMRVDRHPFDTSSVRSSDVNEARRRASSMFDLTLKPIARFAWEGYSPHDADPMWPTLFARALDELARELHHFRHPDASAWETLEPPAFLRPMAADRAARWIHAEARLPQVRVAA